MKVFIPPTRGGCTVLFFLVGLPAIVLVDQLIQAVTR